MGEGVKYLYNREHPPKSTDGWLKDKRIHDGAEGLWRVHDNLYDLSNFIKKHPGGPLWLEVTQGLDITEAFESHHMSTKPEEILKKYLVRQAKTPRSSPFTFHQNGFYRTLKRNVNEALKTIPKNDVAAIKIITDVLLIATFFFAILANTFWSYSLGIIAGMFLGFTNSAAHNYFHQKDNFRMYYADICLMSSREWKVIHVLSHHLYTNTIRDMQVYSGEPIQSFFPRSKSRLLKYGPWIYTPLLVWTTMYHMQMVMRLYQWIFLRHFKNFTADELLAAVLPMTMYVFSNQSFAATLGMWSVILAVHGFWFNFTGVTTTHFHPEIFIDGDKPRPDNERDWGIHQLDAVGDKYEARGGNLLRLLAFGDHALHHLFPAIDQGLLRHLYPAVEETMAQFNVGIRMTNCTDLFGGYFQRLAKEEPNPNPPNLQKFSELAH